MHPPCLALCWTTDFLRYYLTGGEPRNFRVTGRRAQGVLVVRVTSAGFWDLDSGGWGAGAWGFGVSGVWETFRVALDGGHAGPRENESLLVL